MTEFVGRLLEFNATSGRFQLQKDAFEFLQQIAEPLLLVSVFGAKASGKSTLVQDLLTKWHEQNPSPQGKELLAFPTEPTDGVWIYVNATNYANPKYMALIDLRGFTTDTENERLLYQILTCMSSAVLHLVVGELKEKELESFSFLADITSPNESSSKKKAFSQNPQLIWCLRDVSTGDLKRIATDNHLSADQIEQTYLQFALSDYAAKAANKSDATTQKTMESWTQMGKLFQNQSCFPLSKKGNPAYSKRLDKLNRTLLDSAKNIPSIKGVQMNGPLLVSIMVSMLANRENIMRAFHGKIWRETLHNCCLNIVESAIKMYKYCMEKQFPGIVETTDVEELVEEPESIKALVPVELPCEASMLFRVHCKTKKIAKRNLRQMPVKKGKLNRLLRKLFDDLIESLYQKIKEHNEEISSQKCQAILDELHSKMTNQLDRAHLPQQSELEQQEQVEGALYLTQSASFKRFYEHYQTLLRRLISEYIARAKGPDKTKALAVFCQETVRSQLLEFCIQLQRVREEDEQKIERQRQETQSQLEQAREQQAAYRNEAHTFNAELEDRMLDVAKLHRLRAEALDSAIANLGHMHDLALKQQQLLEEAAFVCVQMPCEKVMEAAQDVQEEDLQGYLIKQGGGSLLGRKNWKQRFFCLSGNKLSYARSKDEYERGKIIKELCLTGCRIEPSQTAGEGFDIIPPDKTSHVFERQRGIFEKNAKLKAASRDAGRVFRLRAQSIEVREEWIERLREASRR